MNDNEFGDISGTLPLIGQAPQPSATDLAGKLAEILGNKGDAEFLLECLSKISASGDPQDIMGSAQRVLPGHEFTRLFELVTRVGGESAIRSILATAVGGGTNEQIKRSRECSLDGLSTLAIPSSLQRATGDRRVIAERFLAANEVELRRIAQLSKVDFTDLVSLRFCGGGLAKERLEVMQATVAPWEARNFNIREAINCIWNGHRNSFDIRGFVNDAVDDAIISSIFIVVCIMEVRLALQKVDGFSQIADSLKAVRDAENSSRLLKSLKTILMKVSSCPSELTIRRGDSALPPLMAQPACMQVFGALGFRQQSGNLTATSVSPECVSATIMAIEILESQVETDMAWEPLPDTMPWVPTGNDSSFNIFKPDTDSVYSQGDEIVIRWAKKPDSSASHVRIILDEGDFARETSVRNGRVHPNYLKHVRQIARAAPNTGKYVWKVPEDLKEIEYARITVKDAEFLDDADRSLPFQILSDPGDEVDQLHHKLAGPILTMSDFETSFQYTRYVELKLKRLGVGATVRVISDEFESLPRGTAVKITQFNLVGPPLCVEHLRKPYWIHYDEVEILGTASERQQSNNIAPRMPSIRRESSLSHTSSSSDVSRVEGRVSQIETRLENMETQMATLASSVTSMQSLLQSLMERYS